MPKKRASRRLEKEKKLDASVAKEKDSKETGERQVRYIVIGMAAILLVAIFVYYMVQSLKKFEYAGLDFEKIMNGKLPLYRVKIPVTTNQGGIIANYNLYLRNDPRELREIEINETIRIMPSVVVSLSPEADTGCSDSIIAGGNFFSFLRAAGIDVAVAYNNESYAKERNATYAVCDNDAEYSLVTIKRGDDNRILNTGDCYTLEFKECDILKTTERFIVALYAHSKGIEI